MQDRILFHINAGRALELRNRQVVPTERFTCGYFWGPSQTIARFLALILLCRLFHSWTFGRTGKGESSRECVDVWISPPLTLGLTSTNCDGAMASTMLQMTRPRMAAYAYAVILVRIHPLSVRVLAELRRYQSCPPKGTISNYVAWVDTTKSALNRAGLCTQNWTKHYRNVTWATRRICRLRCISVSGVQWN